MEALTRFVLKHKLLVAGLWLALAVAGALTANTTTSRLDNGGGTPGGAYDAELKIAQIYHNGAADPSVPVLTLPPGQTITSPGVAEQAHRAFAAVTRALPTARVLDYETTHDRRFATEDGRSTFALVSAPVEGMIGASDPTPVIQHAVQAAVPPSWQVRVTGIQALADSKPASQGASVLVESLLGALGALLVLAFVFASFVAVLPLVVAGISILCTFLAVLGLTHVTSISQIVEFLIALIGLGIAIDYSLLVVTRWREERTHGRDNTAAIVAAMNTAGRAVVFSGLTVAIGLLALLALPVPFLRSTGIAGVLIPLISVAVALTLLPVLLAGVGPALDKHRLRSDDQAGRGWTRWASAIVRRPVLAVLVGGAALLALALPVLSLNVGSPSTTALAQSGIARDALSTLEAGGVPAGMLTPVDVLVQDAGATATATRLAGVPGVHAVFAPDTPQFRRDHTALVTVLPVAETNIAAGKDTAAAVRTAAAKDPAVLGITGSGPSTLDFSSAVYGNFPLMLGLIAIATFLLLARAFRSVLLAAKAVVLNLFSLACAYGVLVLVWQQGHGSDLIWGVPASGAITMWVPVAVFAFLFGLSMDYEVFILARMREEYDVTGSTRAAVVTGIGRTGRLVTSAALILMLSFVAMSTAPSTDIKILATGLGAGILVDATLIRCFLVPALVGLFGRWNWWLPAWAARLLRVPPSPARPEPGPAERPLARVG